MDFTLAPEEKMIQQSVREFVRRELIPLEGEVLRNEREGRPGLAPEQAHELQAKAKRLGFWGINTPEEYGGANLGSLATCITLMELGRTFVPFSFGGYADNILYYCNEEQKQRYLLPTIEGTRRSCFALTEPGAGSDAGNIRLSAVKDGNEWVLNGEKIFITNGNEADFAMVFAVTDKQKGPRGGITCFLVDREMGWRSDRISTMG
ncbi:MAG TPA: acyl-CoA dehydrogenase family protein, partial [Ktedonobacterales bacterium]|nr:acyl-CoA dehydrogenase family protein [Ktedonobacterales bacterium]